MAQYMMMDNFWAEKPRCDQAESMYQEYLAKKACGESVVADAAPAPTGSSLVNEIAKAREQIKQSLSGDVAPAADGAVLERLNALAAENMELKKVTDDLAAVVKRLEARVAALEGGAPASTPKSEVEAPVAKKEEKDEEEEDDDDIDLFGSDDEEAEAEAERVKAERVAAYNEKKSKKTAIIAKSSVILDIKPWDDETDMKECEKQVRTIIKDGLVWGVAKLVPLAYGIKKLQIVVVVEDDKVSIDELSEQICEFEDYVQSVDVAAFNKI